MSEAAYLYQYGSSSEHYMNLDGADLRAKRWPNGRLTNCFVNGKRVKPDVYLVARKELLGA